LKSLLFYNAGLARNGGFSVVEIFVNKGRYWQSNRWGKGKTILKFDHNGKKVPVDDEEKTDAPNVIIRGKSRQKRSICGDPKD